MSESTKSLPIAIHPAAALNERWPVLRVYDQEHLARIALPLGGIGTGTVSLGGRGNLRDWEVGNTPAKGFDLTENFYAGAFFALWTSDQAGRTVTRALEGVIPEHQYESAAGTPVANHSLPRFANCQFAAAYPFGQVILSDPAVPLQVRLEAYNPLIPTDPDASGLPVAVLRYVLRNPSAHAITASVCGSIPNFIGADGAPGTLATQTKENRNEYRETKGVRGLFMSSAELPPAAPHWGTLALTTTADTAEAEVTYRTAWAPTRWCGNLLDFWDEFSTNGQLTERQGETPTPHASLAVRVTVPPRSELPVTFLIAWHFPNRLSWNKPVQENSDCCGDAACQARPDIIGNYYTSLYQDAWDAAIQTIPRLPELEEATCAFVSAFCTSDLPAVVKEAALFNISTLRSQTTFRLPSGHLAGWEGCGDKAGCCAGSCTHVWNYENTIPYLFGSLSRSMREVEFLHATADNGLMSMRVSLPLGRDQEWKTAAADGQMGCLMRLYRDWQLSGDDGFLKRLWPQARKSLEFCWLPGGWDADQDGVMEGAQHNTMDVEYHGPNPQMTGWYLGALRACEEMARHLGEPDFATKCRTLFQRGSAWMDEHLFNGQYYEHHIVPPQHPEAIQPGLIVGMTGKNLINPDFQLGAGCLVDQLVGQYMAHVCDLGYLHDTTQVRQTLKSIMKYNFRESLAGHFNHLRSFAFNDEAALLMSTYPLGRRPQRPFPYCNEVMTGFEYTAAIGMLYEGDLENGMRCIQAIRDRYDGRKRSPFDEAECGHHYARAMAAWASVLALTGFHYSAVTETMRFAMPEAAETQWFYATGEAWGTARIRRHPSNPTTATVDITVLGGKLKLTTLALENLGTATLDGDNHTLAAGESRAVTINQ